MKQSSSTDLYLGRLIQIFKSSYKVTLHFIPPIKRDIQGINTDSNHDQGLQGVLPQIQKPVPFL